MRHENWRQQKFLAAFEELGSVRVAARAAGIGRASHYRWRGDPEYQRAFEQAKEEFCDKLEGEIIQRGLRGIEHPVFYKGEKVASYRQFSDVLLMFAARGAMPEKYHRKPVAVEIRRSGQVQVGRLMRNEEPKYTTRAELLAEIAQEIAQRQ